MTEDEFRRAWMARQRAYDHEMTELRELYLRMEAEERTELRAWFERIHALSLEGLQKFGLMTNLIWELEDVDDEGQETTLYRYEHSPQTWRDATKAWEGGEPYVPPFNGVPPP